MSNWAVAILPLVGVILGATLQFWLSRTAERGKHIEALRSEAYSDYLRAVAAAAHLKSDDDLVAALKGAADAKARIIVYGSSSVIKALAKFEESGTALVNEQSMANFIALVSEMRPNKATVQDSDIRFVLFGSDRQKAQSEHTTKRRAR